MPVPSSSKLRPGYSLNFRHSATPVADEAAARLPGFTVHIGLGEWNDVFMSHLPSIPSVICNCIAHTESRLTIYSACEFLYFMLIYFSTTWAPQLTFVLYSFKTHLQHQARCWRRSQSEQKSNRGDACSNISYAVGMDSSIYHVFCKYEWWNVLKFFPWFVFAVSLMFPRTSASYRWVAHLFALLALPVVALHSRCVLPPSVSYCQVIAMMSPILFVLNSKDDV